MYCHFTYDLKKRQSMKDIQNGNFSCLILLLIYFEMCNTEVLDTVFVSQTSWNQGFIRLREIADVIHYITFQKAKCVTLSCADTFYQSTTSHPLPHSSFLPVIPPRPGALRRPLPGLDRSGFTHTGKISGRFYDAASFGGVYESLWAVFRLQTGLENQCKFRKNWL